MWDSYRPVCFILTGTKSFFLLLLTDLVGSFLFVCNTIDHSSDLDFKKCYLEQGPLLLLY